METVRTVRRVALTELTLLGALAAERAEGRRPRMLAVGSRELEQAAVRILSPAPGTLGDLLAAVPHVTLDGELPSDGWELREL